MAGTAMMIATTIAAVAERADEVEFCGGLAICQAACFLDQRAASVIGAAFWRRAINSFQVVSTIPFC